MVSTAGRTLTAGSDGRIGPYERVGLVLIGRKHETVWKFTSGKT